MSEQGFDITEDTLLGGRVRLLQPRNGYRVAVDPVLLAASISPAAHQTVLDVGAGTGAVSLCLQHRCPDAELHGLERETQFIELARRSTALNKADVIFYEGDLTQWEAARPGGYDWVVSNPPFWSPENSRPAKGLRRAAHFLDGMTMGEWVGHCCRLLAHEGRLSLIVPAAVLQDVLSGLSAEMGAAHIVPIWPRAGHPATRLIIQAQKGSGASMASLPGLVLHQENGDFTEQAEQILRDACGWTHGSA